MYKGQSREDTRPHIFAMADQAFRNLVEEGENQSILVTYGFSLLVNTHALTLDAAASRELEKQKTPRK